MQSGSKIIETCSYQLSLDIIMKEIGCSEIEAINLIKKSVEIIDEIRKENKKYGNFNCKTHSYNYLENNLNFILKKAY